MQSNLLRILLTFCKSRERKPGVLGGQPKDKGIPECRAQPRETIVCRRIDTAIRNVVRFLYIMSRKTVRSLIFMASMSKGRQKKTHRAELTVCLRAQMCRATKQDPPDSQIKRSARIAEHKTLPRATRHRVQRKSHHLQRDKHYLHKSYSNSQARAESIKLVAVRLPYLNPSPLSAHTDKT